PLVWVTLLVSVTNGDRVVPLHSYKEGGKTHAVVPHGKGFLTGPCHLRVDEELGPSAQVNGNESLWHANLWSGNRSPEAMGLPKRHQGSAELLVVLSKGRVNKVHDGCGDLSQPRVPKLEYWHGHRLCGNSGVRLHCFCSPLTTLS